MVFIAYLAFFLALFLKLKSECSKYVRTYWSLDSLPPAQTQDFRRAGPEPRASPGRSSKEGRPPSSGPVRLTGEACPPAAHTTACKLGQLYSPKEAGWTWPSSASTPGAPAFQLHDSVFTEHCLQPGPVLAAEALPGVLLCHRLTL